MGGGVGVLVGVLIYVSLLLLLSHFSVEFFGVSGNPPRNGSYSEDLSSKQRNFPTVRGLLCDVVESPLQAVLEQKPDNHLWEIPVLGGDQPLGLIF